MKWYYIIALVVCINFLLQQNFKKNEDLVSDVIYLRDEINELEKQFKKDVKDLRGKIDDLEEEISQIKYGLNL